MRSILIRPSGFDVVDAENADEAVAILEDYLDITVRLYRYLDAGVRGWPETGGCD
jgi:hypothetical protein